MSFTFFFKATSFLKLSWLLKEIGRHGKLFKQSVTNYFETFQLLSQFPFTTGKTGLRYPQKLNLRVTSKVSERPVTYNLRILEDFMKISEMYAIKDGFLTSHPKLKTLTTVLDNWKLVIKPSIKSTILHDFVRMISVLNILQNIIGPDSVLFLVILTF